MKVDPFRFCCQHERDVNVSKCTQKTIDSPGRIIERDYIISQIDRGTEMKFLDIEDFSIQGLLGSGTFSKVFLLVRKKDKRKFAGKFFKEDVTTKDFVRETTITNSCSSACAMIVNMFGIITTPKCLVTEYYENGSLSAALLKDYKNVDRGQKTEFPFLRRLGYILDLCKAVTELHQRNICHRDIALRNLLLSDDKEHVLLADFSLSRIVSSAMEKQLTLTAIVPRESAPETISKYTSSAGRKRHEREYSLKSDIWSVGRTMYGIIDRGFVENREWQHMPTGFSADSVPSTAVFNRIDEVWILILRCLRETPEGRPQSWDLEDKIQKLIENPLNDADANSEYITKYSANCVYDTEPTFEHLELSNLQSPYEYLSAGKLIMNDLMFSSRSLRLGKPVSSTYGDQETSNSLQKINSCTGIKMLMPGEKARPMLSPIRGRLKSSHLDLTSNEYLTPIWQPKLSYKGNTSVASLDLNKTSSKIGHLNKNASAPLNPDTHLKVNRGWKIIKRLGSLTSIFSTSVNSLDETSCDRNDYYCSPLSCSYMSSPTNIAHCKDRRFFKKSSGKLASERADSPKYLLTPLTPDLETVRENSSSNLLVEIKTPRFPVTYK